jgi:hypothetical protein
MKQLFGFFPYSISLSSSPGRRLAVPFSLLCFTASAQTAGDYRSVASGTWATVANWQTYSGGAWIAATTAPNSASNVITIQSPNTISIAASVTADQIIVDPGATLSTTGGAGVILTIANGTGVDLTINGTFQESATGSISWSGSPSWQMGVNGTLIKTSTASSNNWQTFYQGGIANIPATSNWIIRRNSSVNIPLSTTTPSSGSIYPNLTIENNVAGTWTMPAASSFTGSTAAPTIKGNLDIGGSGTGTVSFLSSDTYSSPVMVNGNVTVRSGSTLRNYGTGFEIQGDLTVNGTVSYDADDSRGLTFSGSNAQSLSGTGTLNIYNMIMNKAAGTLTLNRAITVDNQLTLTSGIVSTSAASLLTVNTNASVSGTSNSSFVSGPVRYTGSSAFTFPVGKNSDYQPLSISSSTASNTFWTETFSNGCTTACTLPYNGPNGSWTKTITGTNAANANTWYISGKECGNAAGSCGSTCGSTDPSLHVGANDGFTTPDAGASYNAGGLCPSFFCITTDARAESPVINCTGYSGIVLSFNYIEGGSGTLDNATLWYFDGSTWAQLADMAKTALCGIQGTWTSYSITLPASADNNPLVQIGFRWVNNDDGGGSDPSFAVDDIMLTQPGPTVDFTCEYFYADPRTAFNNSLVAGLDHIDSCEYWTLTRNAGSESKNVTLGFDANSCGLTALTDLKVAHWDGTNWQDEGNTATTGTISAGTVTSGVVTWFSPFTIASINPITPLPIALLSFSGERTGRSNTLKWTTASETNNDYFSLERSHDAVNYEVFTTVNGSGSTVSISNYQAVDEDPFSAITYYRLKQTDYDGHFSYSQTISLSTMQESLQIINAYNENNTLELTLGGTIKGTVQVDIYNAEGRLVFTARSAAKEGNGKMMLSSSELSKGLYIIRATDGNVSATKKVIL